MPKKRTYEEFVSRATLLHEGRYTYEGVCPEDPKKIAIRCKEHGVFLCSPKDHLASRGCPDCGRAQSGLARKIIPETFLARCQEAHKGKYQYPDSFTGLGCPITVVCPEHGPFTQKADLHMRGGNCPKCSLLSRSDKRRVSPEELIARCREAHGGKYTYLDPLGSMTDKVRILCPSHGEFIQSVRVHVKGHGCSACAWESQSQAVPLSEREALFIEKAREAHQNRYDYSNLGYRGYGQKVTILCPVHGAFQQTPGNHLSYGCLQCGWVQSGLSSRTPVAEFVERSRTVHGDKYDYSRVDYKGNKRKVVIVCPEHGCFEQTPNSHLKGSGCDQCGGTATLTRDSFIEKAQAVHGMRYDYSRVAYRGRGKKVTIACPNHGVFHQNAGNHMAGSGCPECSFEGASERKRGSLDSFIRGARDAHGDAYGYDRAVYVGSQERLTITCPAHGDFEQRPADHVNSLNGCPLCTHHYSRPHQAIEAYLTSLGVGFTSSRRDVIRPLELDVYIAESALAIEFNGTFWHSVGVGSQVERKHLHKKKFDLCQEQGISLLQIDEDEWEDPVRQDIWKSILASRLRKHRFKVSARSTNFLPISKKEAAMFLAEHHLQGYTSQAKWCFGLSHKGDLVGVITFAEHEKTSLNLTRMAFASHLTVVGGAQKLFKNALQHIPHKTIVTFSNNRYSNGMVYPVMGFTKDADLPPSYQWLYKGELMNKRRCRHSRLPQLLGDAYDPNQTEHQNMFRAGARCLYDAGYQRWVFEGLDESHSTPYPGSELPPLK